ncbi:cytochrome c [Deinococcus metalli]|nr:cytochrome c [Deinococcus metalli]
MSRAIRRRLPALVVLPLAAGLIGAVAQTAPPGGNPLALTYTAPDAARGQALAGQRECASCHGGGLVTTYPGLPSLAGQQPSYLRLQLAAFRAKLRPNDTMQKVAADLKDQDIADLAAYAATLTPGPAWKADDALRAKGMALFMAGDGKRNLMACVICHGANGRGDDRLGVASITNLAPEYAQRVLHEFKDAPGFPIPHPDAMRIVLKDYTQADLDAMVAYISSMTP